MDENTTTQKEGAEITRSVRADRADFDRLKMLAGELGINQGAALNQLLSFWSLNHAADEMREQAMQVEAVQDLLAQLGKMFAGQFSEMQALSEKAKHATSIALEEAKAQLAAKDADIERYRQLASDAQNATRDAKAQLQEVAARADAAEKAVAQANDRANRAEKKAEDAVSALSATNDAIKRANAELEAAQAAQEKAETAKADAIIRADKAEKKLSGETERANAEALKASAAIKENQKLTTDLDAARKEVKELNSKLSAAQEKAAADYKELSTKAMQLQNDANERVHEARETMKKNKENYEKALAEIQQKYEAAAQPKKTNTRTTQKKE